jgi:hypothetical protein
MNSELTDSDSERKDSQETSAMANADRRKTGL